MIHIKRSEKNPLLGPNPQHDWEKKAAFNPSVLKKDDTYYMAYRALSEAKDLNGQHLEVSTIGYARSNNKEQFSDTKILLQPSEDWDKFGCEDPRITQVDNEYFVFYTALSDYPFRPSGIKVGVAVFSDFAKQPEKHLVTPFNAKAMALFPQKIGGKFAALVTINTDIPPSSIALAIFNTKEEIWSQAYWHNWYQHLPEHTLPLSRINSDQVEVGSVPVLTEKGWLLIYSHIQHYYEETKRIFGIEAVLLDKKDPSVIVARTEEPLFTPQADYEKIGNVPHIVFPSGALLEDDSLAVFYGGADTYCCLATVRITDVFSSMRFHSPVTLKADRPLNHPLLLPEPTHSWESKGVFNPAVIQDQGIIYLVYRALGADNTSVFGCAKSTDGISISERHEMPVYVPRAQFETRKILEGNAGCEDPRITKIGDTLYMCYTAFDGTHPPRVAFTSISLKNFINEDFNWKDPILISPPGISDKDAALFPEKINGKYIFIHRIQNAIVFDQVDSLNFGEETWLRSLAYISPRGNSWDSEKIGLCTPPLKTPHGWLILYHGISSWSHEYRVGAMLLDLEQPEKVISRTPWPLLEPLMSYEKEGNVKNVVFPCGTALKDNTLFIYYGAADTVIGVVTIAFSKLIDYLLDYRTV